MSLTMMFAAAFRFSRRRLFASDTLLLRFAIHYAMTLLLRHATIIHIVDI